MKHIVTISREYGSGGHELARCLAQKHNIPFYDREIIRMVAQKSGIALELVEDTGEYKSAGWTLSAAMPNVYTGNVMDMLPPADRVYIVQSDLIQDIANRGDCVIVGRSADYILRERKDVLSVFVHADMEKRTQTVMQRLNCDEKTAAKTIAKLDKQRALHSRHYTDRVWGMAHNYDLSLNCGALGFEKCVELITLAMQN